MLDIRLLYILHTCIGCICSIASSSITTLTFIAEIRTVIGIWTTTISSIIVTFKVVCDIITKTITNHKVKIWGAACSICLIVPYGNIGCQVSKREIQNCVQQGLEIRGFWFQKKTVQLKTALREVNTYVLNGFFFQKTVYLQGF
jgi:hypothetical protein